MVPSDQNEIYATLGKLEAMAEQGIEERKLLFSKLDAINDKIGQIAGTQTAITSADNKAEAAHDRLDKLVDHLDNVKGKALMILGSAALGTAGASHAMEPIVRKIFGG